MFSYSIWLDTADMLMIWDASVLSACVSPLYLGGPLLVVFSPSLLLSVHLSPPRWPPSLPPLLASSLKWCLGWYAMGAKVGPTALLASSVSGKQAGAGSRSGWSAGVQNSISDVLRASVS